MNELVNEFMNDILYSYKIDPLESQVSRYTMDLSFTLDGGKLTLEQVKLEDVPRAVELLRQSFVDPPLFEADGLTKIRALSTDEIYERFLAITKHVGLEPVTEMYEIQASRLEKVYLYRAEIFRRTRDKSRFVRAYEAYVETKGRTIRLEAYNHMLRELGEDTLLIAEDYEEQKRTKELMLEILRRPQVLTEINQVVRSILGRVDRSQFKFHLSPLQYHYIMSGTIEDEPLDVQEDLLLTLQRMRKSL